MSERETSNVAFERERMFQFRRVMRYLNKVARDCGAKRRIHPDEVMWKTPGFEGLDICDVVFRAGASFGVDTQPQQARDYFGWKHGAEADYLIRYHDRVTWRGLAEFLLSHLGAVSINEAIVLGRRCGPAGAFYAIRDILAKEGFTKRFAPSSRIRTMLTRSQLAAVWARLRWLSRGRLRAIHNPWGTFGRRMCAAGLIVFFLCPRFPGVLVAAALIALGVVVGMLSFPTLPDGIRTFRDLAVFIWDKRDHQTVHPEL
ncbi:MAG: hypothetical protein JNG88_17530 [Phycisphaerales bacterium]|nr:hypothetical protein [Phycisphaerales bacterium]